MRTVTPRASLLPSLFLDQLHHLLVSMMMMMIFVVLLLASLLLKLLFPVAPSLCMEQNWVEQQKKVTPRKRKGKGKEITTRRGSSEGGALSVMIHSECRVFVTTLLKCYCFTSTRYFTAITRSHGLFNSLFMKQVGKVTVLCMISLLMKSII